MIMQASPKGITLFRSIMIGAVSFGLTAATILITGTQGSALFG